MKKLLVSILLFTSWSAFSEKAVFSKVVTDVYSGTEILIEQYRDHAVITNLKSGESLTEDGDFSNFNDREYSNSMMIKRLDKAHEEMKRNLFKSSDTFDKSGSYSGSYEIYNKWTTPKFYVNETSVDVEIDKDGDSNYNNWSTIYVELIRERNWWPDKSHGKKTYSSNKETETWNNIPKNYYYYLKITKTYNGGASWGTYNVDY